MLRLSTLRRPAGAAAVALAIGFGCAGALARPAPAPADLPNGGVEAPARGVALAQWAATAGFAPGEIGAIALPLDGGPALVAFDEHRALNPASTIKLLTTWAALSLLGPDYRWETAFHLRGRLEDGVLRGDLVVRGGGDPKLVIEDLVELVGQLRAGGLERIDGDLVLDDSIYEPSVDDAIGFDGEPWEPYNVQPFGAMMNFKSVRIVVRPSGKIVELAFDPDLAGVAIDSAVRLVGGPCRHGANGLQVRDAGGTKKPVVRISGVYSRACGEQGVFVSVLDHRQFVGALFGAAWKAAGGHWRGRTRIERGAARDDPWYVWRSPRALREVVHDINKFSNNVMARHLLLQLAARDGERPATLAHARALLLEWLRERGLPTSGLVLDNGSGLSRVARASAAQLAAALRAAALGPDGIVLRDSLPVVGIDGTMKARFVGEAMAGRAWIKTGSLDEVRAIAGYVFASSGRPYAIALIVNGPRASASRALQDAFLRWVHDNG